MPILIVWIIGRFSCEVAEWLEGRTAWERSWRVCEGSSWSQRIATDGHYVTWRSPVSACHPRPYLRHEEDCSIHCTQPQSSLLSGELGRSSM